MPMLLIILNQLYSLFKIAPEYYFIWPFGIRRLLCLLQTIFHLFASFDSNQSKRQKQFKNAKFENAIYVEFLVRV